jgi:hypothetical protein
MMLGSQCSPCCGGSCQDFNALAAEWDASSNVLLWSFTSDGFGTIPVFSVTDEAAYYTSSVPTFFRPGFSSVVSDGSTEARFHFALLDPNPTWGARFRLFGPSGPVSREMYFQCRNGSTLITASNSSLPTVRVDDQTYDCCCVQHGSNYSYPIGSVSGCGDPSSSCVSTGACANSINPFGGFFETYTSFGFTMSLRLLDWRLFRTNPLP